MKDSDVSSMLSGLPSPPMPDDVAAAIEARLTEEARSDSTVVPLTPRHTSRLNWLVAAAAVVAFLALIGFGTSSGGSSVPVASAPVVQAGAVFEPADFAEQLQQRFYSGGSTAKTNSFADSPTGLKACAASVHAYGKMMFVDVGTYDQVRAVVLVSSYPPNTDYEEVYVVAPDCGEGSVQIYRHMIYDVDGSTQGATGNGNS